MANRKHLDILEQGVVPWNRWRRDNPKIQPDLSEAHLVSAKLTGVNLARVDLYRADLFDAILDNANLCGANLNRTRLMWANLSGATLRRANLQGADLYGTCLRRADLTGADLMLAQLVDTDFEGARLTNCRVWGVSAWNLNLRDARQSDLIITPASQPTIVVDNLEVAQFLHLILNNERLREVIDAITSKVVLILGRFTARRKAILDAIREELRERNYVPVLFDFQKPVRRDVTETVSTLAHMARFIIADITDARSIPQELEHIVPALPSVPVQPLLQASADKYGLFAHFERYPWVLKIHLYEDLGGLLKSLREKVIEPAEAKARELLETRGKNTNETRILRKCQLKRITM